MNRQFTRVLQTVLGSPNRTALTKGSLGTLLLRGAAFPAGFLVSLLLARFLGITEMGVFSEALAWSSVVAVVGTVGLDRYAVREISANASRQSWDALGGLVRRLPLYALAFGVSASLIASVLYLLAKGVEDKSAVKTFAIAIMMAPVMSLAILRQGMLQGLGRVVVSRLPEDGFRPGLFALAMLLVYGVLGVNPDSVNAMAMQAGALIVTYLIGAELLRRHLPSNLTEVSARAVPIGIVRDALPLGIFAVISIMLLQVGVIVLGFTSDPDQLALYATAFKIAIAVGLAEFAVNNAYQPMAAAMIASGDTQGLSRVAPRAGAAVLLLALPISIPILLFSGQILSLFGPEFVAGEAALRILGVSYVVSQLFGQNATILMMSGNASPLMKGTALAFTLNIALSLLLTPEYGATGAAIAWLVTVVFWNFVLSWWVRRTMHFSPSPLSLVTMKQNARS